jgi:TIR domain
VQDGFDVFFSYHAVDHATVTQVAQRLHDRGIRVFLDRWYLAAGQPWPQVRMRCACQIRCTARKETPTARATARPVQCVRFARRLHARQRQHPWPPSPPTAAPCPACARSRPSNPCSANGCCQRHTAGRLTPAPRGNRKDGQFLRRQKTIQGRWTCFCGRFRSPTTAHNRARSSAPTMTLTVCAMTADSHGQPAL